VIQESDKNKVVIRWDLRASPEELFDAWTDAEGMRTWICPGNILSVVGGNLLVIKRDTDKVYEHRGELLIHEHFPRKEASDQYRGGWSQNVARLERYLQARRGMYERCEMLSALLTHRACVFMLNLSVEF
jgi:hypothetical protein